MSQLIPPSKAAEIRYTVRALVNVVIEGGDDLCDLVSELAELVGVPYGASKCVECSGWVSEAGDGWGGMCGNCADRAEPTCDDCGEPDGDVSASWPGVKGDAALCPTCAHEAYMAERAEK